jgi:hypothetical protein
VNALQTANTQINNGGFFGTFLFVPVVDGTFITQRPTLSLQQSKVNGVRFFFPSMRSTIFLNGTHFNFCVLQEALLSVTNTFEGTIFVDQNTAATANATQYALKLFPGFRAAQADKVGQLYAGLGTALFQENAIQGECAYDDVALAKNTQR